jgi:hypothetical protein
MTVETRAPFPVLTPRLDERQLRCWAAGLMLDVTALELSVLATSEGEGTPVVWSTDADLTWAWFGAEAPFTDPTRRLTASWIRRLIANPSLADELSGVFALMVVDRSTRSALVAGDRLGIQAIHVARSGSGSWLVSTHLTWLLLHTRHDGAVNDDALLGHLGFGYPVGSQLTPYVGVTKVGSATVLRFLEGQQIADSYWTPPDPGRSLIPADEDRLLERLRTTMAPSSLAGHVIGLTSGKDSLCLISAIDANQPVSTATFGQRGCADQIQALSLSQTVGSVHTQGAVCSESEFFEYARQIAFHSAGLATASYVDMTAFVNNCIPLGHALVMGEGGECIRDFFSSGGRSPLDTLRRDYMTPLPYLKETLAPHLLERLAAYPETLLDGIRGGARKTDESFALEFYRAHRMPGNFSLRHAVLSASRPKTSPFLDRDFMNVTYSLALSEYADSRIHRRLIERSRPALLPFFDKPCDSPVATQDWRNRFPALGPTLGLVFRDALSSCDDVFDRSGVLKMCDAATANPDRAVYYLFRVLSFALGRQFVRAEAGMWRATVDTRRVVLGSAAQA